MISRVNTPEKMEKLPALPMQISMDNLMDILAELDDGVIITDEQGTVVFYNEAISRIDNMERSLVIGKKVTDIYNVTRETSPTMQALLTRRPVLRFTQFYLTHHGRAVFALQNVFPLFEKERFKGVVNFIREYSSIEREMDVTSRFHIQKRKKSTDKNTFDNLIGSDPEFLHNIRTGKKAAPSPSPVMIYGESGTGKELFAQAIHNYSPRSDKPFVAVNCSAIPETLLEGILFGTAKGAFTDARDKPGLFEDADGGTLFLDEIGEMPQGLQAKLLRAIQERKVRPVGGTEDVAFDVRIVSATNRDLRQAATAGEFREDIFFRLAIFQILVPPLRERREDIPLLIEGFLAQHAAEGRDMSLTPEVLRALADYSWPGNVRELRSLIERCCYLCDGPVQLEDLPEELRRQVRPENRYCLPEDKTLDEVELEYIKYILARCEGNRVRAAEILGINRKTIQRKLKE